MNYEQIAAVAVFAAANSISPGPNNTMVLASGVRFGLLRSVPHIIGITIGFCVLLASCALGLHSILIIVPGLATTLRYVAVMYLAWMAWKIATAPIGIIKSADLAEKPVGFWGAAAFQWVNPKAWVMALGCVTAYVPAEAGFSELALVIICFGAVNLPCVTAWAAFGSVLKRWLQRPLAQRCFNVSMAVLLVISLIPLLT